jgi:hypothetical protein
MKPTFQMQDNHRKPIGNPVPYTALIFTAGVVTHRLALHRENTMAPAKYREWQVSHPGIGAKICRVTSSHKGVPVSSAGLTVTQARAAAVAELEALCDRIGSDKFNTVIYNQGATP